MKVLRNNIVIKLIDDDIGLKDRKTSGGIFLPEKTRRISSQGKVIAIGDEVKSVKVGDLVLYGSYTQQDFFCNLEELAIVNEDNILLIFDPNDNLEEV